jgi:hypothetical protein
MIGRPDSKKKKKKKKNNKQHGIGKYTNSKGETKEYEWEGGKRVEEDITSRSSPRKASSDRKKSRSKSRSSKKVY